MRIFVMKCVKMEIHKHEKCDEFVKMERHTSGVPSASCSRDRSKQIFASQVALCKLNKRLGCFFNLISEMNSSPCSTPCPTWLSHSFGQSFLSFFFRLTLSSHIGRRPENDCIRLVCEVFSYLGHRLLLALIVCIFLLGVKVKPKDQVSTRQTLVDPLR